MEQMMDQAQPGQPGQPQPGQPSQPAQGVPEEMKRVILAAMRIVYDAQISKQLLQIMEQGEPANAVARAALIIIGQLQEKGAPPQLAQSIAPHIVATLLDLATAAKVFQANPQIYSQAIALITQNAGKAQEPAQGAPEGPEAPQGLIDQRMGA